LIERKGEAAEGKMLVRRREAFPLLLMLVRRREAFPLLLMVCGKSLETKLFI